MVNEIKAQRIKCEKQTEDWHESKKENPDDHIKKYVNINTKKNPFKDGNISKSDAISMKVNRYLEKNPGKLAAFLVVGFLTLPLLPLTMAVAYCALRRFAKKELKNDIAKMRFDLFLNKKIKENEFNDRCKQLFKKSHKKIITLLKLVRKSNIEKIDLDNGSITTWKDIKLNTKLIYETIKEEKKISRDDKLLTKLRDTYLINKFTKEIKESPTSEEIMTEINGIFKTAVHAKEVNNFPLYDIYIRDLDANVAGYSIYNEETKKLSDFDSLTLQKYSQKKVEKDLAPLQELYKEITETNDMSEEDKKTLWKYLLLSRTQGIQTPILECIVLLKEISLNNKNIYFCNKFPKIVGGIITHKVIYQTEAKKLTITIERQEKFWDNTDQTGQFILSTSFDVTLNLDKQGFDPKIELKKIERIESNKDNLNEEAIETLETENNTTSFTEKENGTISDIEDEMNN